MTQEGPLRAMFAEFITEPLWRHADKLPQGAASGSWDGAAALLTDRRALLAAAAAITAVGAGVLLWRHRQAAPTSA